MEALGLTGLSAGYGRNKVVDDVSFTLARGNFLGIIGPNGAGKSTLVKAIARVLPPMGGTIRLFGRELADYATRELARSMACVPQFQPVPFAFTVAEFVGMGRYPHSGRFAGQSTTDRRATREAMELLEVLELRQARIGELSGGEMQRVFIAQAMAQQADLLIMDEPTSHLDISHQVRILDRIKAYSARHDLTVITILHDLNLTSLYCNQVVLMHSGRVYAAGSPQAVITQDIIQAVYATRVVVQADPVSSQPHVYIVPQGEDLSVT